ncbi:hypothetical protein KGF54_002139 [Candida jiufengensis]|uniref:uncharacterized protein n=1 Tax=Candida jiufengensis TaxID=497108 RepID=UPI0022249665|nr:uncharacterized protein KGF54_002139 [Candida jiufengensis]KAI5954364.1 hypothetical protein KGF54_002139 [Candida jiufengensis]
MKLANALKLRSELNTEKNEIINDLKRNLIIQEGLEQQKDPKKLYERALEKFDLLQKLIISINKTNIHSKFEFENQIYTIAEFIILKSEITDLINLTNNIIRDGEEKKLNSNLEIRFKSWVDIKKYELKLQKLKERKLAVEMKLEEINWQVDLIE